MIDAQHWDKFPAFQSLKEDFNKESFTFDFYKGDFVFMRWKEHFLVPDHRIKQINGASVSEIN